MKFSKSTFLWKILLIKEEGKMKYIKPTLEIFELEASDIMSTSGGEGSITVDDVTITGPKDSFSQYFDDLL